MELHTLRGALQPARTHIWLYTSCTVYKNDSQRSYRLLATVAGYQVVSLTLIITARCSPRERFGLNVSCQTQRELTVAAT